MIELLIVITLIAVLSALATENYLLAVTRAKVARTLTDHRTLATAIEAYTVDHNSPPRMAHKRYGSAEFDIIAGQPVAGVMSKVLSTPTAYITEAFLIDPFMVTYKKAPLDERMYTYQVLDIYAAWNPDSKFWPSAREFYGAWRIGGVGPDQAFDHLFVNSAQLPYDPTNGVISMGNIWTSQRGAGGLPPIPDLLAEH
ncbi:type II secretion system protein [Candidatus Sumerlaeota bacterium]|nr:type II secretion system protein [Candidatus Sumerlaeota bacterium]